MYLFGFIRADNAALSLTLFAALAFFNSTNIFPPKREEQDEDAAALMKGTNLLLLNPDYDDVEPIVLSKAVKDKYYNAENVQKQKEARAKAKAEKEARIAKKNGKEENDSEDESHDDKKKES